MTYNKLLKIGCNVLILICLFMVTGQSFTQSEFPQGPIVAGLPVSGEVITFQDIGTDTVWEIETQQQYSANYIWASDGCKILFRGSSSWDILNIFSSEFESIPSTIAVGNLTASVAQPIWHPDGQNITFSIRNNLNTPCLSS